jgi:hypothetical protein
VLTVAAARTPNVTALARGLEGPEMVSRPSDAHVAATVRSTRTAHTIYAEALSARTVTDVIGLALERPDNHLLLGAPS